MEGAALKGLDELTQLLLTYPPAAPPHKRGRVHLAPHSRGFSLTTLSGLAGALQSQSTCGGGQGLW